MPSADPPPHTSGGDNSPIAPPDLPSPSVAQPPKPVEGRATPPLPSPSPLRHPLSLSLSLFTRPSPPEVEEELRFTPPTFISLSSSAFSLSPFLFYGSVLGRAKRDYWPSQIKGKNSITYPIATMDTEKALALLRSRLYDPNYVHATFKSSEESNYCKLKFLIMNSISDSCNNSILLLGPRGSGKVAVVDLVLEDLKTQHPDSISVIRLNGLLHSDDNFALKIAHAIVLCLYGGKKVGRKGSSLSLGKNKTYMLFQEIARQLCLDHQLLFSKMASSDDNAGFMIDMLKECGLSHKSIIFVLDEFDLFAQGKQRLLYSLLDAMQTVSSQAVVIGVSCRLDADQLLEKRVRSRFSHRKLLFVPPSREDVRRLLEHILYLPKDIGLLSKYVAEFNSKIQDILNDKKFQEILDSILFIDGAINNLVQFLFRAVSSMSLESGLLSLENFKDSHLCYQRQPKTQILEGVSILELYILVCMNRLECKEQNSYNFNSVMKEYKAIHEAYKTSDNYRDSVCLRAFEHLLERELIGFVDNKGRNLSIEIQPVKLLISPHELYLGLKSRSSCPAILQKLFDHESFR
ncbi:hypothetical protein ZIOFF_025504 [Zingiber officinale]|uniref:Origin of replication complex subunit 4 n=1 Tax=Zingiber officinale TaxID=94328 RepID=A0A8J5LEN1_ZINOF|nr:hypothetical protein ZIOFF_025504 [Zingiber officinale]